MLSPLKTSQHGGSGDPGISLWSHYDLYRIIYWIDTMNNPTRPAHIKIDVSPRPNVIFWIHLVVSASSWSRTIPRTDQILTVVCDMHRQPLLTLNNVMPYPSQCIAYHSEYSQQERFGVRNWHQRVSAFSKISSFPLPQRFLTGRESVLRRAVVSIIDCGMQYPWNLI